MNFEVVGFDGREGRLSITTDIGQFWKDFTLYPEETVSFNDLDTLIDEGIIEVNQPTVSALETQDFSEVVLSDPQVQEQLEEDRFLAVDCHHDLNDYYGVSHD